MASTKPRLGKVEGDVDWQTRKPLAETNLYMLEKKIACDVTFRVGPTRETIQAHTFMLISRSHVFEVMFTGPMAEAGEVKIPDVDVTVFKDFLRFVYTDDVTVKSDNVIHLLYLAKKYSTGKLEDMCLKFLETSLQSENACTILEQAKYFNEEDLEKRAMTCILENGKSALESSDVVILSQKSLLDIVKSDDLQAVEKYVFQAAVTWAKNRCKKEHVGISTDTLRKQLGEIVQQIRFPLLDREYFVRTVIPSGLLTQMEQLIIHNHSACKDIPVAPFSDRPRNTKKQTCKHCRKVCGNDCWLCYNCNACKYCGCSMAYFVASYGMKTGSTCRNCGHC